MVKVTMINRTNDPVTISCGSREILLLVNGKKELEVSDAEAEHIRSNCPSGVLLTERRAQKQKIAVPEKTKTIENNGGSNE